MQEPHNVKDHLESLVNLMVESGVYYEDALVAFEKRFIHKVLDKYNWNQSRAAQVLGMHRNTLSRKIELFNLNSNHKPRNATR